MKVCIPTADNQGLDASIHNHFGSAPFFVVVDSETQTVEVIENHNPHHEHGQCAPTKLLEGRSIEAVVCQGMGQRAVTKLQESGIAVYVAAPTTAGDALAQLRSQALQPLAAADVCHGHH